MLLKQADTFIGTAQCDTAFAGLKKALCNAPVLALPGFDRLFKVICDACGMGSGTILPQNCRPIAFDGKRMNPADQVLRGGEQELLAVTHALELWRCYLDGAEGTILTDPYSDTFCASKSVVA